jgi:hypothetical protein
MPIANDVSLARAFNTHSATRSAELTGRVLYQAPSTAVAVAPKVGGAAVDTFEARSTARVNSAQAGLPPKVLADEDTKKEEPSPCHRFVDWLTGWFHEAHSIFTDEGRDSADQHVETGRVQGQDNERKDSTGQSPSGGCSGAAPEPGK